MNYPNSTFQIKPSSKPMVRTALKKSGKRLRPVRKVVPNSEAWMKQKITIAFSKWIRKRDPFCYCGAPATACGHYFSRAIPATEYDSDNCLSTCERCNYLHEENKEPMKLALIARIGLERFDELERRSWDHGKLTYLELEDLAEQYKPKGK